MDILAHALWSAAGAKAVNRKWSRQARPLKIGWTAFWGVAPDLAAFTIPFVWMIFNIITGRLPSNVFGNPATSPPPPELAWTWNLGANIYNFSHSAVIFALVFLIIYLIRKRPYWELSAWLLHVLIDIPTHTNEFYPTPFLWPLSDYKISGFSWFEPWFMILNYGSLLLVYLYLFVYNRK